MKKFLSIILTILMLVTSVPFALAADETPPTRIIDGKTYYELDSADDLYWFAEQVNVNKNDTINAILTADIVINENLMSKITVAEDGTATINEGETVREWIPIKYFINSDMVGYKGIFDGSNHTISGLYGNSDDMHYMGFFALANGATIKNLGIIDSYFYEYQNVASVVALARNTTIINCFSENCLIANESQRAGGIAGMLYNSNIIRCYNASTIRESGGGYYIGGIVGESVSTTISDCFNTGSIVATGDKVGGIVGCINSSSAVVENCYNIGKINSDSEKTGGIAGENWGSVIDCYFNSEIFSGSAIGNNEGSAVSSEGKTALQFASGEVAYAFGSAWGQKLGTDPYPVLGSADTVYRVATYTKCDMSDVPVCEYNNTSGSDINNAPQHVLTGEITCMGKLCEVCGKYYGDADESKHLLSWKTAKEATCAEPGLEIYNCEVCGNAPAMETVLCDSATYPESEHNYPSQANEEYAFSYPGATKLVITFSEDTETEENYDFIYIYDSTGTEYGKYSGTELAGVQIDLEGGSFKIKLTSDVGVNGYGFRLASVYATAPTAEYQKEIPALGHNWSNKDGICAKEDCGYECPHENFTDGICDACGYECTHESYTAGKCNACGYECPHEGQNGSCEVCGANLGKLVIDVTDKSYVEIGTGHEYYDEDGYIITGANQNTDVYIYESADLTLKNAVFSRLIVQYAPEGSVFDITLEGANEVVGFIGFMKEHLIFNGSEGATLKTPYIYTNGGKGTATVNGGNIILDLVTEYNIPTIECNGGFTINGGTVTASNNYYCVVYGSVTLNGGELNIISTSADYEAIEGSIIIEKGALLTVSATKGILDVDSDIVMADDAEENDYFFVRYDTESEFVPVQDIEAALDGKTYAEIKIDTHEHDLDDNGKCVCGYECPHESFTGSKCNACGYECPHEGQNGSCEVCGANLGKLVIDVTDKADVSIGNGQTYYDEDGYIITGTNKDLIVYVYEEGNFVFRNASFKSFWLNGGDYEVTITLEGDNYLATTEDYYCGISFGYHHLTIEGGENDTLNFNCKASAISTSGNPGTCTVNGGKINAVTETDQNYSTLRSFGGFIMNGGEVTLSNNYCDVVGCPVTLNGGVLNVIGTSTDCAAVNQKITVEKGALLTVSSACGIFSDWYGTDIVVADDAEENTLLFAKYNTEDEFAPVYDIKSALDGKTYTEIKADTHNHSFTNDECVCGFVCEHTDREDGFCTVCKRYIYEITHQPTSGEPYVELNDDTDASYQWYEVERRGPEITEENADTVVYDWGESSYDKETGWTGVAYEENITGQDFFTVALKAGETVIVELTGDFTEGVGLWDYNTNYGVLIEAEEGVSSYEITVGADGDYTFYTFVNSGVVTVKAYTGVTNYTAIEGEASAEIKNPEIGKRYVCEVTYGNGTTEMTDVLKYSYAITHQPTSEEPYVELSDDTDASYQWYTVEDDAEEITDENAKTSTGTYSAEYGWSPMIEASSSTQYYFSFDLKAGDKVTFEFSSVPEIIKFSDFIVRPEETTFSYVADLDRNCELIAHYDGTEITARAYLGDATYTAIEGENSAELKNADIGKNYACEVTFADGTTEMSDTFEVTNLHECDFTGEWKYDADKHWKECTCGETGEEAEHTYTDGKCECGYECPHVSYTDGVCDVCNYLCPHSFTEFTETVAPKCEESGWEESYCDYCSIKLEQEIPALDHDWVSGGIERPYQNIDGSWTDGYYYDSCKNDGTHINITGVAKRADYSAYDEAYKSLKAAQKNANLTDAGAAAVNQAVMTGMTMPQNIVEGESTTAYLNNWVKNAQSILAKIENGEYLKADYTEIDEAIASVDTALENASISDEMTEELEDIKAELEALKENENATMADVNALLDRTEAIAETMNNCANGVHSFTKYEEEAAPKCGVAGKEAAICDNGCGATDENEIPALAHKDDDGDYLCDHGCGHEFEKPVDPTPDVPDTPDEPTDEACDHLCHKDGIFGFLWKIIRFFYRLFNIQQYCDCGEIHYDAPVFG